MPMRQIITTIFIAAVLFCTALNPHVSAQVVDGPIAREHLKRQVLDLLYLERFTELEKMATQLRVDRATFPDGLPKLHFFYEAFSAPKNKKNDGWLRFMSKLKAWVAKYPDSATAGSALAFGWMHYGWEARGGGYANTVTPEGWRLFGERLDNAEVLLEKKPAKPAADCPERYDLLLALAKAKGLDMPHFESLFHDAVTFDPTYPHFYLQKAGYLDPKWHGEEGDEQRFAEETAKIPEIGKILYMRIAWSKYLVARLESLEEAGISWTLLKQGFIDARRSYPKSPWLLNNFCKFACLAGDRETAKALFLEIGNRPYIEAWNTTRTSSIGNVHDYKKWRTWALGGDQTEIEPIPSPQGTEDFRETLVLANSGDAEAQFKVGKFLDRGEQVKQDRVEAERWLRKAAEQGLRDAQMYLGMVYFNGSSPIRRDFKEAAKWYYVAAMQGEPNCPSSLATMYDTGYGLEKDLVQAYIWYSLNPRYKENRVEEIAAKLSPEQLAKAGLEIKRLRSQTQANVEAAELSFLDPARIPLPAFKAKASPPPEDFGGALILAKSGDAEAQFKVAKFLDRGEQVKQDRVEAERWLRKAAEQGLRDAQMYLGMVYFNGWAPIRRDLMEAAKWYYVAAMQGEPNSPSLLASMYDTGYGLEKDLVQAYIWYSLNPRYKEKRVEEIAAKLSPEQLAKTDLEVKRLRSQIQANVEKAKIAPFNPASVPLPVFK